MHWYMSKHVQIIVGGLGKAMALGYARWEHVGVDGHMSVERQYGVRELWGLVGRGQAHA